MLCASQPTSHCHHTCSPAHSPPPPPCRLTPPTHPTTTTTTRPHLLPQAKLQNPQLVRLDQDRKISPDLSLSFFTVRQEDKLAGLMYLVRELLPAAQPTIIFASTRHHVEFLYNLLSREGIQVACVFGTMDQTARKIHVAKFRAKKVQVLITTDVAARGIDIPLIDNVINYDFPAKPGGWAGLVQLIGYNGSN
jgi:ATP-dependent RNA helicase DDX54/DBP10